MLTNEIGISRYPPTGRFPDGMIRGLLPCGWAFLHGRPRARRDWRPRSGTGITARPRLRKPTPWPRSILTTGACCSPAHLRGCIIQRTYGLGLAPSFRGKLFQWQERKRFNVSALARSRNVRLWSVPILRIRRFVSKPGPARGSQPPKVLDLSERKVIGPVRS
jgi:hypothetical protein